MSHKRPPIPVIVILTLAILTLGYFGIRALVKPDSTGLTASGTIEVVEVNIAPELGGKVIDVPVEEGATVNKGDVLFRLDGTILQAQRNVAAATLEVSQAGLASANAALAVAQANYELALNSARATSAGLRTSEWGAAQLNGSLLPGGYFQQQEEIAAAQVEVETSGQELETLAQNLKGLLDDPANALFVAAEKELLSARTTYQVSQSVLGRAQLSADPDLIDTAQKSVDDARIALEDAQATYDNLKESGSAAEIIQTRSDLAVAQERLASARDHLLALQYGEYSPQLAAAQAVLNQALASVEQATLAVKQANANLELLDAQISRLTITAPSDGTILTSTIQPGEILAPSATAMTLAKLSDLTITVYIPEDLYGGITLGQSASMTVDSFPGETFVVMVTHIADQAEFTPRNVQTVEGRSTTVFAITLRVQDAGGKLKPGMPADVSFTP